MPRETGPFERHLRGAIDLNRARAPLYAALTGGASLPLSRSLVRAERLLLPVAWWMDRCAEPYHRAGVPLLADLFAPMEAVPAFEGSPLDPPPEAPAPPSPGEIRRRVRSGFRAGGLAGARSALEAEVERLAADPCFDCMLRHLLESALRLCTRAPLHLRAARLRGMPPPEGVVAALLRLHLAGLGAAARLDGRARTLQAAGIPILCRDVPTIPADGDLQRPR